jgi:putative two-component system response regulator
MKEHAVPALCAPSLEDTVVTRGGAPPGLLHRLLASSLILREDWDLLDADSRQALLALANPADLLPKCVEHGLLTDYQAARVEAGTLFGLILGNYRILDRLGAGGMGVVFRAEHIGMRRKVAIKVLPSSPDQDPGLVHRFLTEIRAVAQLQHPNIVSAIDMGQCVEDGHGMVLHFFVMEYVPGEDLEEFVYRNGPLSVAKACDLMYQVASALAEACKHNLVHRDIKPSNIQVTPEGQAKLLDFGLARRHHRGLTEPGMLIGTLEYMAPEQIQDASAVDIRADLYGLGGVLYWSLTGTRPFPSSDNLVKELAARMQQQAPSLCERRPEMPVELDHLIKRLMALHPDDRFATPQQAMRALLPFLRPGDRAPTSSPEFVLPGMNPDEATLVAAPRIHQILIVDDEPDVREFVRCVLQSEGLQCHEVSGGLEALEAVRQKDYDLLLLDIDMPDLDGTEVCRRLRESPPGPHLKIIMVSAVGSPDMMAHLLLAGADDLLSKPFGVVQLQARVKAALRLKQAQDQTDILNRHLLTVNLELEQSFEARSKALLDTRDALAALLAKAAERRASTSTAHALRLPRYCSALAEEAARSTPLAAQIDAEFLEHLECAAPLHDVGMMSLPDYVLLKPGKLDAEERMLMQAHAAVGAEMIAGIAKQYGRTVGFLDMAVDVARHHHERHDGRGYPDRLAGADIPLAARIVAIADVYDALRCRRVSKPALAHDTALHAMFEEEDGHLDPVLFAAFRRMAPEFERIFREQPES